LIARREGRQTPMEHDGYAVTSIRSVAKYLGFFGAGAVTAAFFLSGPVDLFAKRSGAATNGGWVLVPPTTQINRADWTVSATPEPMHQPPSLANQGPNVETTGSSAVQREAGVFSHIDMTPQRDAACNVPACRRFYRSFDEATCTYRPYGGGPPQLCNR